MAVSTNNAYGKISISDLAIARVTAHTAAESYGIVIKRCGVAEGKYSAELFGHCLKTAAYSLLVDAVTALCNSFFNTLQGYIYAFDTNVIKSDLKALCFGKLVSTENVSVGGWGEAFGKDHFTKYHVNRLKGWAFDRNQSIKLQLWVRSMLYPSL